MLVAEEDKRLSLDADEFYVPDLVGMTVALQVCCPRSKKAVHWFHIIFYDFFKTIEKVIEND